MRAERGVTILEALIAAMLLAVMAAAVFSAFGIGLRAARLARGMSDAANLAEEALTEATIRPCGPYGRAPSLSGEEGLPPGFERAVEARQVSSPNLWEITATVTRTAGRRQSSVTLATYRSISVACGLFGR